MHNSTGLVSKALFKISSLQHILRAGQWVPPVFSSKTGHKLIFLGLALVAALGALLTLQVTNAAFNFNDPGFSNLWNRVDKPVQSLSNLGRGYTWGPPAPNTTNITTELYNGVSRKVQYFDKARMEVNNPAGN